MMEVFLIFSFLIIAGSASNAPTNFGNDFQLGFLKNYRGFTDTKLGFYIISNCTYGVVNVTIQYYEPSSTTISEVFNCRSYFEVKGLPLILMTSLISNHHQSVKISTVNSSQFISVVAYNWQNGSVGEYMGLPCIDPLYPAPIKYDYYLVSVETALHQNHQLWSQALLISCHSNTSITVTPSVGLSLPDELGSDLHIWIEEGESYSLVLDSGDSIYIGKPNDDITGSHIVSSGPLTVISGHECANVPTNRQYCDHFVQQIPPTMTWGKEFLLSPFMEKDNGQYYKIVTSRNAAVISHNCNEAGPIYLPYNGDYTMIHVNSTTSCYLVSNVPVLVVQIATSSGIEECRSGDPFMFIVQPIEQYLQQSHFRIQSTDQFSKNFIGLLTTDNSLVLYDGESLQETKWTPIRSLSGTVRGYSYHFEGSSGFHTISFTRGSGTVMLYGFQCNPERGYGYPASVQFKQLHTTGPKVYFLNEIQQKEEDWQYSVSIGGDLNELFELMIELALNVTVQKEGNSSISYQIYPVVLNSNISSILEVIFNIQTIIDSLHSMEGDKCSITVTLITEGEFIDTPSVLRYYIEIPSMTSFIIPTISSIIHSSDSHYEQILTIHSSNSHYESILATHSSDSHYESSSFQFLSGLSSYVPTSTVSSSTFSPPPSTVSSSTFSPPPSTVSSSTFSPPPSPLLIINEGTQSPPDQQLLYFIVLSVTTAGLLTISIIILLALVMVVFLRRQKLMSRDCKGKISAVNPITTEG